MDAQTVATIVLGIASALFTIASIITNATDTPPTTSKWSKVYKVVEIFALIGKKAKRLPGETSKSPHDGATLRK